MKFSFKALAIAAFSIAAAGANAQSNVPSKMYAEIGYASIGIKGSDGTDSIKSRPGAFTGIFGYQVHPNIAVEGFLGLGGGKDGIDLNGAASGVDAKIESSYGFFVKPSVMVSDSVELFARGGILRTKISLSAGNISVSGSDTDVAYGVGLNYNLSKTSYIQGNWTSYYNQDGVKASGVALAYGMRF
ncbi:MAG: outer membrane beta-barrel protein [Hydrogenophaga sp.]|uniref:outer membrane beta-barrel protein n=1 Tax=Hydrogenophaga sp. TaxID=1904254 RepID=UPI0027368A06|nr:outer membrane beta-barrel protein [Hydrogenophaga sp.]MDP3350246.1 outer membrane beta-barrel protein [Hydrogenophaga sp.]